MFHIFAGYITDILDFFFKMGMLKKKSNKKSMSECDQQLNKYAFQTYCKVANS